MGEMECTMVSTQSLKQNHLFRRLYQRGKSAAGRHVVVYCRKNGLPYNRLGLTVGTKVGHAVVRNRIRRRLREAYRLSEGQFLSGYDIVSLCHLSGTFPGAYGRQPQAGAHQKGAGA